MRQGGARPVLKCLSPCPTAERQPLACDRIDSGLRDFLAPEAAALAASNRGVRAENDAGRERALEPDGR